MSNLTKTTLREFYDKHVVPDLPAYPPNHWFTQQVMRGIEKYGEFLGRAPTLADLNEKTFMPYVAWLDSHVGGSAKEKTTYGLRKVIRLIWRKGHDLGVLKEMPVDLRLQRTMGESWKKSAAEPRDKSKPKTLRHLYLDFFEPLRLRGRSEGTRKSYRITLNRIDKFLGRAALLSDLTDALVTDFLQSVRDDGASIATANKAAKNLLCLWRYASRKRIVDQWPDVIRFVEPIRVPRAWTKDELDLIWRACKGAEGEIAGVSAAAWWTALHHVMWWSGERIGALMLLRWSDLDAEGWLVIPAEFRKGGRADKATKLPPVAIQALSAIRKPERELIFAYDRYISTLWTKYKRILQSAGLPSDRKSKFHRMRKSAASHYQALGGNAQLLCGHATGKITESYIDPRIAKPPQAMDLLFTPGEKEAATPCVIFEPGQRKKGGAA